MSRAKTKDILDVVISEAQARTKLNASMLKLRNKYGFAPEKGISQKEMQSRCDDLVGEVRKVVKEYVRTTGKAPDRMKNRSRYVESKDFPRKKYEGLQEYANVPDDKLKKAPLHTSEAIGNLLNFNADYLLKSAHEAAVKARTRKEWQRAEYEYVEKNDYNLRDLYDDLMQRLDDPFEPITVEEYREERRKWKKCGYYACDNYFPREKGHMESDAFRWSGINTRRSDAKYCCGGCRKKQENALVRLEKTGTLLPEHAYEYILDDARENRAENEVAKTDENIEKIARKR